MKDNLEGFEEFKSVRLISAEDRRLPASFIDKASHTNKIDIPNNNNNNNNNNDNNKRSLSTRTERM